MKTIAMTLVLMMGMATTSCVSTRDTVRINQVEIGKKMMLFTILVFN